MKYRIGELVYHKTDLSMRWMVMEVRMEDISTDQDMAPIYNQNDDSIEYILRGVRQVLTGGSVMHRISARGFELQKYATNDSESVDALKAAISNELRDGYCFNRFDEAQRALRSIRSIITCDSWSV